MTARLPEELVRQIDETVRLPKRSRAEIIRQAIAHYLDDVQDLAVGMESLNDPPIRCLIGPRSNVRYSLQVEQSAAGAVQRIPKPDRIRLVEAIDRGCEAPSGAWCSRASSPVLDA